MGLKIDLECPRCGGTIRARAKRLEDPSVRALLRMLGEVLRLWIAARAERPGEGGSDLWDLTDGDRLTTQIFTQSSFDRGG